MPAQQWVREVLELMFTYWWVELSPGVVGSRDPTVCWCWASTPVNGSGSWAFWWAGSGARVAGGSEDPDSLLIDWSMSLPG